MPLGAWLRGARPAVGALAEPIAEHLAGRLALKPPSALGLPEYPNASLAKLMFELLDHPLVNARLAPRLRVRLQREVERQGARLNTQPSLDGLVHSDFSGSNLLIEEDAHGVRIGAVVDWEFAHLGSALIDLGHLLRAPALRDRSFTDRFTEAMATQGRPLAPGWIEAATLVDILAWLYFLSRPPERPRLFADCRARLEEILVQLGD
ncbi:hypothetical protein A5892_00630 [Halotalea alkalilenta]|uniref:Aminoglycoside phosphotransferase domain-containing protein n=2 Tax=Halotalea alkalilenta TaxID=376489 RepID=A0A172YAA8_9GAMM|nr:hypothetical protein A5892_00630 [Halotalea alkalilenta]